jgi:hypothetical protein
MLRYIMGLCLVIILASCHNNTSQEETVRYYEDGRAKAVVLVVPVIDSTTYDIPWSLSEEFTDAIKHRLTSKGMFYLSQYSDDTYSMSYNQNPYAADVAWIKDVFSPNEFIVFLELVEHVNIPSAKSSETKITNAEKLKDISTNLNMAIRLRVIDNRGTTPQVILQELLTDSYFISKNHIDTDYSHIMWGMTEYNTSPMGMAHNQISKELAERIKDYILLAKSR